MKGAPLPLDPATINPPFEAPKQLVLVELLTEAEGIPLFTVV